MNCLTAPAVILLFLAGEVSRVPARNFENQYLSMTILGEWTVRPTSDQKFNLSHGKYLLSIDPIFVHASGIKGGRFDEIAGQIPSVKAVAGDVIHPPGAILCAQVEKTTVTAAIWLNNLYTDSSKAQDGCVLPAIRSPVWFCSFFSGEAAESEYTITLGYDTTDVNRLPKKGSAELAVVLGEAVRMLKTLQLKAPIVISRVDPPSAPPGATVTIYGSGFRLPHFSEVVMFREFPNNPIPPPIIAGNGKSLAFRVPTSIDSVSCQKGYIDVNEGCVPAPANHVDVNDCPPNSDGSTNFCGKPIRQATYHIWVYSGYGVGSNVVPFRVTAPKSSTVSILLIYPNQLVSEGATVTVRGGGFTPSGNTVRIGSGLVIGVPSRDGKTLTFQAPAPSGSSLTPNLQIYEASVSNSNGESNSIIFWYR